MPAQTISDHVEIPSPLEKLYQEAAADANAGQRDELRAAAKQIAAQKLSPEQAEKAFRRAADAITNGISVFRSYKFSHKLLAKQFADVICYYGQNRLKKNKNNQPDVYFAEHSIEGGKPWREDLEQAITNAHWFILLLPDVEFERDWPIYEAGYFKRGMAYGERLICVHHKDVIRAPQLEDFQTYQSSPEDLNKMLMDLFFTSGSIPGMESISFDFNRNRVAEDAEKLSVSFQGPRPKIKQEFCMRFIEIQHKNGLRYASKDELLHAQVVKVHDLADAFDRSDSFVGSFSELIASVNDDDHGRAWVEALRIVLNAAVCRRPTRAVEVPFLGFRKGTAFRPSLQCVQRVGEDGPVDRFHVVFIEDFGQQIPNAPADLDALETTLRWSYRGWWEIYEQYRGRLNAEDVDDIRRYTERAEQEVQARGMLDSEEMLKLFAGDTEAQATLKRNLEIYYKDYRNGETGKIDRAFGERDPKLMKQCLDELRPMTLWFLKRGSKRYAELLDDLV